MVAAVVAACLSVWEAFCEAVRAQQVCSALLMAAALEALRDRFWLEIGLLVVVLEVSSVVLMLLGSALQMSRSETWACQVLEAFEFFQTLQWSLIISRVMVQMLLLLKTHTWAADIARMTSAAQSPKTCSLLPSILYSIHCLIHARKRQLFLLTLDPQLEILLCTLARAIMLSNLVEV